MQYQNDGKTIFTLKMATTMFAKTLDNYQHSTRLNPQSRSYTMSPTHSLISLFTIGSEKYPSRIVMPVLCCLQTLCQPQRSFSIGIRVLAPFITLFVTSCRDYVTPNRKQKKNCDVERSMKKLRRNTKTLIQIMWFCAMKFKGQGKKL
jgi:hypothetical protein